MLILIAIVGGLAVALAAAAAATGKPNAASERVGALREDRNTALVRPEPDRSLLRSSGRGLGHAVMALLPASIYERIDGTLERAGRPLTTPGFLMLSLVCASTLTLFALAMATSTQGLAVPVRIAILLAGAAFGLALPAVWLRKRVAARSREIWRSLPDASDLLTTCVEAGLGVDAAFVRVAGEIEGPLAEELETMLREISLGRPRDEAMMDVGRRSGVEDLDGLLSAVRQAQETGTSLARVLRAQSQHVRTRRKLLAEEQARMIPAKMTFPIVFLTVPTLFVLILGPVVIEISEVLPL